MSFGLGQVAPQGHRDRSLMSQYVMLPSQSQGAQGHPFIVVRFTQRREICIIIKSGKSAGGCHLPQQFQRPGLLNYQKIYAHLG